MLVMRRLVSEVRDYVDLSWNTTKFHSLWLWCFVWWRHKTGEKSRRNV